jgi:hypothetical protein
VWTKDGAIEHGNKYSAASYNLFKATGCKLFEVKVYLKDIGAIIQNNKLRCWKIKILRTINVS